MMFCVRLVGFWMTARSAAATAAVALLAAASPARAGFVDLRFDGYPPSPVVSGHYPGGKFSGGPGPYLFTPAGSPSAAFPGPVATFCVDLGQYIAVGRTYTFEVLPVDDGGNGLLYQKLWGAHYDPVWATAGFKGSTASAAFQIASWELAYDGPDFKTTPNVYLDNFRVSFKNPSAASKLAQEWLAGLSAVAPDVLETKYPGMELVLLRSASAQDQMALAFAPPAPQAVTVPAPPAMALGLVGVGGALLGRFRRRPAVKRG